MPPPSSGGVALIQMLNILEGFDLRATGAGSAATSHLLVEAMKRAFADRSRFLGDADFVQVPLTGLISKEYAALLRKEIDPAKATPGVQPGKPLGPERKSGETTHFSVVDAEGNAVSCTTTINSTFGSRLVVRDAGFLLNNEMDDFAIVPGEPNQDGLVVWDTNAIEPGKRMLSSMTPTIVTRAGRPFLVLGSPGSGRIINTVLQVLVNVVDHGMPLPQAVAAPRIHHQWLPDVIRREPLALVPETRAALEALGHEVDPASTSIGRCQAILVDEQGMRHGAADARSGGAAVGT
jgi:gamma-glutamyltranspeptidase/glutathione hydrolase